MSKCCNTVALEHFFICLSLHRAGRSCKSPAVKTNSRASRKKCYQTALAQITSLINHLLTGSDVASYERHPKAKALLTPPVVSGCIHSRGSTHTHRNKIYTGTYRATITPLSTCVPAALMLFWPVTWLLLADQVWFVIQPLSAKGTFDKQSSSRWQRQRALCGHTHKKKNLKRVVFFPLRN